eukprot:2694329-Lingulodinium_polyedra.AAC.1
MGLGPSPPAPTSSTAGNRDSARFGPGPWRPAVPAICPAKESRAASARSPMDHGSSPRASARRRAARCPGKRS